MKRHSVNGPGANRRGWAVGRRTAREGKEVREVFNFTEPSSIPVFWNEDYCTAGSLGKKAVMRLSKAQGRVYWMWALRTSGAAARTPVKGRASGVWLDFLKSLPILKSWDFRTIKIMESQTEGR